MSLPPEMVERCVQAVWDGLIHEEMPSERTRREVALLVLEEAHVPALLEALRFYATRLNWHPQKMQEPVGPDEPWITYMMESLIVGDNEGDRARAALERVTP